MRYIGMICVRFNTAPKKHGRAICQAFARVTEARPREQGGFHSQHVTVLSPGAELDVLGRTQIDEDYRYAKAQQQLDELFRSLADQGFDIEELQFARQNANYLSAHHPPVAA
jgi:hypothetical protein